MTAKKKTDESLEIIENQRIAALSGRLIDRDLDEELQKLVAAASRSSGFPVAMVTLVLRHTVFFRAHVGLPPELELTRGADRCSSFCHFVVREGQELSIHDVTKQASYPQQLFKRFGIRAYHGIPLRVRGEVIGSFCVLDTEPHSVTAASREKLRELARRASQRLGVLAVESSRAKGLLARSAEGGFDDIRNSMVPLLSGAHLGRKLLADLAGIVALAEVADRAEVSADAIRQSLGALKEAAQSLEKLDAFFLMLEKATVRSADMVSSIQDILRWREPEFISAEELIEKSMSLAEPSTRQISRLKWAAPDIPLFLAARPSQAIALMTLILSELAEVVVKAPNPTDMGRTAESIDVRCELQSGYASFDFRLEQPRQTLGHVASAVKPFLEDMEGVSLISGWDNLRLTFTLAPEEALAVEALPNA